MRNGLFERRSALIGDFPCHGPCAGVAQQDDELIAAEAGHQQVFVHALKAYERAAQLARDVLQHGVANRVPERVIDPLGAVQIEIDNRHSLTCGVRVDEELLGRLDTALAIRQPRQRVVIGEPFNAFGRRGIAQDVREAALQQCPVHRLGNEVGRARVEGAADGGGVLMPGHHDDRHGRKARFGAQPAANGITVHARHVDVEQDDRHLLQQRSFERRGSIVKAEGFEARNCCCLGEQQAAEVFIVCDDRYRGWLRRHLHRTAHALARCCESSSCSISAGYAAISLSDKTRARSRSPVAHSRSSRRISRA